MKDGSHAISLARAAYFMKNHHPPFKMELRIFNLRRSAVKVEINLFPTHFHYLKFQYRSALQPGFDFYLLSSAIKKKKIKATVYLIRYHQKIVHVVNLLIKCDCVMLTIHIHEQYKSSAELNWVDSDHIHWVLFKILGIENSWVTSFKPLFSP